MRKPRTSYGSQQKSQLRLPRRSVRKSRAMPPLEVRERRNSASSIPTRPAAQFQTPRTMPREIAPNAVQTQIRAQWPRELPRKVADATGSGHWNSKVGQYFFRRHAPGPLQSLAQGRASSYATRGGHWNPCARPCKFRRRAPWPEFQRRGGGAAEDSAAYGCHLP